MERKAGPKRVLLLTNSEHGQANVHLAVAYALLTGDEDVEVHLASFAPIRKAVTRLSEELQQDRPEARQLVWHQLRGIDMHAALMKKGGFAGDGDTPIRTNRINLFWGAPFIFYVLVTVFMPWTGPEYEEVYHSIAEVIKEVQPDIAAVDPTFSPGLTACRNLGTKILVLAPNTIKDFSLPAQRRGEALWKFPCIASGLPYPIPWYWIPLNFYLIFVLIIVSYMDTNKKAMVKYVQEHIGGAGLVTVNDLNSNPKFGAKILVANLPELEYPLEVIPRQVVPCGPMLRPARPVIDVDPGLAEWLSRGPTVYINMGTHAIMPERLTAEWGLALRQLLDASRSAAGVDKKMDRLQVLWKLVPEKQQGGESQPGAPGTPLRRMLGPYLDDDTVRIVRWIEPEPTAVLAEKNIVCAVHHGGANSFLEAVSFGIPQVVMPVWIDTFDFACRAELLGIGRWGNKTAQPFCRADELGPVLLEVVLGSKAVDIRARAREMAKLCRDRGGGSSVAASIILRDAVAQ